MSFTMGSCYLLQPHFTSSSSHFFYVKHSSSNNNAVTKRKKRQFTSACMRQDDTMDVNFTRKRAVLFVGISVLPFLQLRAGAVEGLVASECLFLVSWAFFMVVLINV